MRNPQEVDCFRHLVTFITNINSITGDIKVRIAAGGSSGGTENSGQHGISAGENVSPVPRPLRKCLRLCNKVE